MGRRILFTVTNDLQFYQRMRRICGTLSAAGYDVTLVGRRPIAPSSPLTQAPYTQIQLAGLIFSKGKLFYLEFNLRLLLFLLFKPCDAICSIDLDTAVPGIIAAKLRKKIHIFDAHELFTHVPEVARRPRIQAIWEKVQAFTFKHCDAAFTVGPAIAQYFTEKYHRPVEVVRNMPLAAPQNSYPDPDASKRFAAIENKKFILYQGALNEGRGLELLIQAMTNIPCELVLAGEGDMSQPLRKLTQSLHLENKVHFLGMIPPHQLPDLTKLAYIGFNVSENVGLSYYLSLNNKFFDYTQSHLPSLINPYPEYKQLLLEFQVGLLTEPTVESIIEQANELLNNQSLYQELKSQCIAASEKWTWEQETPKLLSIFESSLLGTPKP
jgi:glycosyltransferase involved in cell wall biosynthesis